MSERRCRSASAFYLCIKLLYTKWKYKSISVAKKKEETVLTLKFVKIFAMKSMKIEQPVIYVYGQHTFCLFDLFVFDGIALR